MDQLAEILCAAGADAPALDVIFRADMETIHRLTVPGAEAVATWERLRALVPQTGCWPVLLGEDRCVQELQERLKHLRYPRAVRILEEAATIDAPEWFENRRQDEIDAMEITLEEKEDLEKWMEGVKRLSTEGPYRGFPEGPWPAAQPTRAFPVPLDPSGAPRPHVHVGLVSTALGGQTAAFLRYGAWDECPSAAEHVAVCTFWEGQYGAEVVAMAGKAVEMMVARPPENRDDALELAAQQYLYCKGAVAQGAGTLQRLAAALVGAPVWRFWWD